MEIKSYFSGIQKMIVDELNQASEQIDIAVAWFTNHEIYDVLLSKAQNVKIRLVVINDDVNNRFGGLNFQEMIDAKGEFYFAEQKTPMHNKYCIIDDNILITGSFNYTYWADSINDENVIKFLGCNDIIESYKSNFEEIIARSYKVTSVEKHLKIHPFVRNLYSYNNFIVKDIYNQSLIWKDRGKADKAEELIKHIENESIGEMNIIDSPERRIFTIENVVYRQWKDTYVAKQIWVNHDEIVIRFQTSITDGCYIWGLDMLGTWTIQDSNDKSNYLKASKVTNISVNGKVLIKEVIPHNIYRFICNKNKDTAEFESMYLTKENNGYVENNGNKVFLQHFKCENNDILLCDIHFYSHDFSEKIIDLVEGRGSEDNDNHWHCFDINMKLNRIYKSETTIKY